MRARRNGHRYTPYLTGFFLLSLTGLGTPPAQAQERGRVYGGGAPTEEQTVTIEGRVRADDGRTVPTGISIRLESDEGMILGQQPTSTDGQFEFVGLPKIFIRLTVTADGYQPYQQDLNLRTSGGKMVVNISMTPAARERKEPLLTLPSLTDGQASKPARKEYEKGVRALQGNNLKEAQAHLKKAVGEFPCYARAQTDLALVLSKQSKLDPAEAALQKSIECDPGYLDAYSELGQLLFIEKKYSESESVLQQGLRRSPASWQFYYQLASVHYGLKKYREAEGEYLKAESFSSAVPPEIHVKLADVYLKMSAFAKAYTEMQAYLRAEPDGRFAARVKGIMQKMQMDGILTAAQPQGPQPVSAKP